MLKSLELFGFKSFADRTIFEFHEGITGVVGPNGSGKSNVVDSIKWLLGDQSAKSLRGKEMTDVIFNGSSSRGGAQFAEATLTFDNTTRFLPLDIDMVSIGRRLWKSGDSEYLVNNTTARLKDVRELLTGTGAGASSYCIIEQGRVDQILQSNAANRRLIFEEAAGISRFKQRRVEAERRLERVEQNLLRLSDIVSEVDSQVGSIRGQAKRAMQHRDLSQELERFWVGMVADDFRRQAMVRERLAEQQRQASETLEEYRHHRQAAHEELDIADKALADVDEQLRAVEQARAELRSRIASQQTTLEHHATRELELQNERERLQQKRSTMEVRAAEAEGESRHLQSVQETEQQRFTDRKAALEQISEQLETLQSSLGERAEQIDEHRDALAACSQRVTELRSSLARLQHQQESSTQRQDELLQAQNVLTEELTALQTSLQAQTDVVSSAEDALRAAEEAADELLGQRTGLLNEQTASRESLANLREQRSAVTARKTVLEDLEDRQEGFGIGAREILRRAEEGTSQPWSLIRGSVADLLDVDMDNAALLEVALSGRAQLLVIDQLQPLVDYLNSGRCQIAGRVGFVSLERTEPVEEIDIPTETQPTSSLTPDNSWKGDLGMGMFDDDWFDSSFTSSVADEFVPDLKVTWVDENGDIPPARSVFSLPESTVRSLAKEPGVLGRADSLARSPRHLPSLAAQLLADTWVVQSLDDAFQLQKRFGTDYRFVTLQGELVEKDGTLHTGTVRSESAVVSRKSELRRLKNEMLRIEHLITERDHSLQQLVTSIEAADSELQERRDTVERCSAELRSAQQQATDVQQSLSSSGRNEEKLLKQLATLAEQVSGLATQLESNRAELQEAQEQETALQERVSEEERRLLLDREQVDVLERRRAEAHVDLTRTEERLAGTQDALERLKEDLQQRHEELQDAARRFETGSERLSDLTLSRLNVRAEAAELQIREEQLGNDIFTRSQARREFQERRKKATDVEREARRICQEQESKCHDIELKITGIDHQLETSAERIRDEFNVSVDDALARNCSAVAEWLTEEEIAAADIDPNQDDQASGEEGDWLMEELEKDNAPGGAISKAAAEYRVTIEDASAQQILRNDDRYDELRTKIEKRVNSVRQKLKRLGNVGTDSLDNLTELEARFDRLQSHLMDLEAARDALREMVKQINVESERMFAESFEAVRGHFRELFRRLFGGGEADVILEDPEAMLECAIDIVARPPGKELRSLSLLSGGEKTMTAVALLLAIFRSRPSPFCLLDEVDAALDDANIGRFVGVLKDFQDETQFIMITHRKPTMAVTDVLYGVTMEESGISKRLVVRFEEIDEQGNFADKKAEDQKAA